MNIQTYLKQTEIFYLAIFIFINVSCNRKYQIVQHLETTKHISYCRLIEIKNTELKKNNKTFDHVRTNNQNINEFNKDLCNFKGDNNISLFK